MNNIKQAVELLASAIQDIQSRLGDNMDYSITKQVEDILKEKDPEAIKKADNELKVKMGSKEDLKTIKNSKKK